MFGHDSDPTRIYSYGAREPIDLAPVERQMQLAHRYKNELIEIELRRRRVVAAILSELSPTLTKMEDDLELAERAYEIADRNLKNAQTKARKKVRPADLVEAFTNAKTQRSALYKEHKTLKSALYGDPRFQAIQYDLNVAVKIAVKKIRKDMNEPKLYWGSKLHVEQSMSDIRCGAPPEFAPWTGDGHITVQVQGGLGADEVFQGNSTLVQILPVPPAAWERGGKKLQRTLVSLRIGSDDKNKPVWAKVPIILHRPLPENTEIKWVHLIRWRVGTRYQWRVQFSLSRASGWAPRDCSFTGAVGIDVGWRMRPDGSLRVAYWHGEGGTISDVSKNEFVTASSLTEGELTLSEVWLAKLKKTRDIQSIRDKNFDDIRSVLAAALDSIKDQPEWIGKVTATMASWKSQARLTEIVVRWRTNRFTGDDSAFYIAEEWRKRERHLYEYEANLRDQLYAQRTHIYRRFVAEIRRVYKDIKIERLDLRQFHELPDTDEPSTPQALKEHVRDARLSDLRGFLFETGNVIEVKAQHTTADCSSCGSRERFDHVVLVHTCSQCKQTYDQDRNAAINILRSEALSPAKKER